jgi:nucleoid-associated protein YgaU
MKRPTFFCLLILGFSGLLYADRSHVVKRGEVLSSIAEKYFGSPVYRPRTGSLAKLLALNPSIQNADRILPGQEIHLGVEDEREPASEQAAAAPVMNAAPATPVENAAPVANAASATSVTPVANATAQPAQTTAAPWTDTPNGLFAFAGFGFTTLHATDDSSNATAELNTSRDLSAGLGWLQVWSRTFATSAALSARNVDFQASTNVNKTLTGTNKTLFHLSLDAEQKLSPRLTLNYGLGMGQELFLHGLDSSSVTVDAVAVPQASLEAQYEMYRQGSTSAGGQASIAGMFPASYSAYDIKSGSAFGAGIFIRHQSAANRKMDLRIGYFQRNQDTSVLKLKETSVSALLNLTFPLFEGSGK